MSSSAAWPLVASRVFEAVAAPAWHSKVLVAIPNPSRVREAEVSTVAGPTRTVSARTPQWTWQDPATRFGPHVGNPHAQDTGTCWRRDRGGHRPRAPSGWARPHQGRQNDPSAIWRGWPLPPPQAPGGWQGPDVGRDPAGLAGLTAWSPLCPPHSPGVSGHSPGPRLPASPWRHLREMSQARRSPVLQGVYRR